LLPDDLRPIVPARVSAHYYSQLLMCKLEFTVQWERLLTEIGDRENLGALVQKAHIAAEGGAVRDTVLQVRKEP
jgi:hypothetical protein